jgi:predicted HD superfamily hydrolase involved in NAD metabolism
LTRSDLCRAVRAELGQRHRYGHTLRVARLAASLARLHGYDAAAALDAGLLHDLARLWKDADLLGEFERRTLGVDAFERANPVVLHARLGAILATERFGVTDERVLEAIRTHTLGAPGMGPIAQIIYLADALEPGRTHAGRDEQLRLARADLNVATYAVLASTLEYQRERRLTVAPQTRAALAWYAPTKAATIASPTKERTLCPT